MRLALLGLAASLSVQPLLAQDNLRVSQAPVTITATLVRTGTPGDPKDRPNDADVDVVTRAETARYGNGMVIRAALADAFEQGLEEVSISGWSLVAVWANWPETGNGYKFFARKKGEDPVLVPDEILKLELTDPYVAQKLTRRSGNIVAGSDTHKSLAELTLGGLGIGSDSRYETNAGTATGVLFGTGRYTRPAGATTAIYLPQGDRFVGYGATQAPTPAIHPDAIITVTLSIGASHGVPSSIFAPPVTPALPVGPSEGPGASPQNSGSGTITVGSSGDLNTVPGGSIGSDAIITVPGGAPNLGAAM